MIDPDVVDPALCGCGSTGGLMLIRPAQPGQRRHLTCTRRQELQILFAILCLGACETPDAGRAGASVDAVVDTTGVSIIQLRGEDAARTVRLDGTSSLGSANGVGGDDGSFFRVVGAAGLDGNRTVVANRGTNQLVLLDSLGRKLGTIGRHGRGPGEFIRLSSILRIGGDTIAALDGQLRRISVLTADGEIVRDYVIQPPDHASVMGLEARSAP